VMDRGSLGEFSHLFCSMFMFAPLFFSYELISSYSEFTMPTIVS